MSSLPTTSPARSSRSPTPVYPLSVLRPFIANSKEWPRLKRLQNQTLNITTFDASTSPASLRVIPYPCEANGKPLPPSHLWDLHKMHDFKPPHCFHDRECRIFTVTGTGKYSRQSIAACGHPTKAIQCTYWVSLSNVAENKTGQLVTKYYCCRSMGHLNTSNTWPTQASTMPEIDEAIMQQVMEESARTVKSIASVPPLRRRVRRLRKVALVTYPSRLMPNSPTTPSSSESSNSRISMRRASSMTSPPSSPTSSSHHCYPSRIDAGMSHDNPIILHSPSPPSRSVAGPSFLKTARHRNTSNNTGPSHITTVVSTNNPIAFRPLSLPSTNTAGLSSLTSVPQHHAPDLASLQVTQCVTPPRGYFRTLLDLDTPRSVDAQHFSQMFRHCPSCNYLTTGRYYDVHICDL